ncbi:hypothetical protein CPLU01_15214 [Colletotrichum plurivorum]|uniref:Uncharacterized protein n=1 Tax=Colletotrichum plurivorum TaxID=2175906 RepID=A0A8H6MWL6_9PEZI|nr:hypothetical protein CPLU01_15214 [Colletotrichum plurivorum]
MEPATWVRLMANQNATGRLPFNGPNFSEPNPANDGSHSLSQEWAIWLDLEADIPLEQTGARHYWDVSNYVAGGVISLTPPEDLLNPYLDDGRPYQHDRTWKVYPSYLWKAERQKEMHEKDSCEPVYPPECVDSVLSEIKSAFMERYSETTFRHDPQCPSLDRAGPGGQTLALSVGRYEDSHIM